MKHSKHVIELISSQEVISGWYYAALSVVVLLNKAFGIVASYHTTDTHTLVERVVTNMVSLVAGWVTCLHVACFKRFHILWYNYILFLFMQSGHSGSSNESTRNTISRIKAITLAPPTDSVKTGKSDFEVSYKVTPLAPLTSLPWTIDLTPSNHWPHTMTSLPHTIDLTSLYHWPHSFEPLTLHLHTIDLTPSIDWTHSSLPIASLTHLISFFCAPFHTQFCHSLLVLQISNIVEVYVAGSDKPLRFKRAKSSEMINEAVEEEETAQKPTETKKVQHWSWQQLSCR